MTDREIFFTPAIKEPKITHALATSSAFNLKLRCMLYISFLRSSQDITIVTDELLKRGLGDGWGGGQCGGVKP